jgi:hypothetical protein
MNGSADDAYGAWSAESCVGLASLGAAVDGSADKVCLSRTDGSGGAWARRSSWRSCTGPGTAALHTRGGRARRHRFILPLLARIGPMATSIDFGGYTPGLRPSPLQSRARGRSLEREASL